MSYETAEKLDYYTTDAKAIAWDNCHKIYVLMDDEQVALMRKYGYGDENDPDSLITSDEMTPEQMSQQVAEWFEDSCGLRFVSAVNTYHPNPNEGFIEIIPQGVDW